MATRLLPEIVTARTQVRLARTQDRDAVLAYYLANRVRLTPYNPRWPDDFFSKGFWERQIAHNLDEFHCDLSARMFVFAQDEPELCIANVSLSAIMRSAAQFCYLGYGVSKECEGRGYMTEAVAAVVEYGFSQLGLHRIMANYMPTNERSGRLLKRLGFVVEGYARDYLCLDGVWQDHILTAKTNQFWRPLPR